MSGGGGATRKISPGLTELLGRALTDEQFREELFTDRARATRGFRLSDTDRSALDQLSREDLQAQAERLGQEGAMMPTVSVKVTVKF